MRISILSTSLHLFSTLQESKLDPKHFHPIQLISIPQGEQDPKIVAKSLMQTVNQQFTDQGCHAVFLHLSDIPPIQSSRPLVCIANAIFEYIQQHESSYSNLMQVLVKGCGYPAERYQPLSSPILDKIRPLQSYQLARFREPLSVSSWYQMRVGYEEECVV